MILIQVNIEQTVIDLKSEARCGKCAAVVDFSDVGVARRRVYLALHVLGLFSRHI